MRIKVSVKGRVIGGVCRVQAVFTGIDKELINTASFRVERDYRE